MCPCMYHNSRLNKAFTSSGNVVRITLVVVRCFSAACFIHSGDHKSKWLRTPMFTYSKCQICVHSKHEPQAVLTELHSWTKPDYLKEVEHVSLLLPLHIRKTRKMMMIPPSLLHFLVKFVKFGQIDHCWGLSSDKAPEHWTKKKEWVNMEFIISPFCKNELSFFIFPRNGNCPKLRGRGSKRRRRC